MSKLPLPRTIGGDPNFYRAVRLLRRMGADHAHLALFAALFWDDEKLDDAELAGDLPGRSAELKPHGEPLQ
jgi:hypothetical protein